MKIITKQFSNFHMPVKALLIYKNLHDERDIRVEAFDVLGNGQPINAHPLSDNEAKNLAKTLSYSKKVYTGFLHYEGVIPTKLLYVDQQEGYAIWYTPAQPISLLFKKSLTIPCGKAHVPALVWKAGRDKVSVFALTTTDRPTDNTPLFNAPFFNINADGEVCMGSVDTDFEEDCDLPEFMNQWEHYFFNSYFSHLIGHSPINGNLVSLWQQLMQSPDQCFPTEVLKPNGKKLKDVII
jgi:PRTRC genetic system protein B